MDVGCGQNIFEQHRCSRRECVSAALHPVVGSHIRHEWEIFVVAEEGGIKKIQASEPLKFFQQSLAKFCPHCHGVTSVNRFTAHPNHLYAAMTLPVTDWSFSKGFRRLICLKYRYWHSEQFCQRLPGWQVFIYGFTAIVITQNCSYGSGKNSFLGLYLNNGNTCKINYK